MVVIFWHNPCTAVLHACTAVHQSITTHSASSRQLSSWIIRTIVVQTREICCGRQITRRQWADEEVIVMQHFLNQRLAPVLQKGLSTVKMLGSSRTIPLRFLDQLELNFQFHLIVCSVLFSSVFYILCSGVNRMPWNRTLPSQSSLNGPLPEIFPFSASKCFNQYALKCKLDYGKQAVRWEEKLRG